MAVVTAESSRLWVNPNEQAASCFLIVALQPCTLETASRGGNRITHICTERRNYDIGKRESSDATKTPRKDKTRRLHWKFMAKDVMD